MCCIYLNQPNFLKNFARAGNGGMSTLKSRTNLAAFFQQKLFISLVSLGFKMPTVRSERVFAQIVA